jgi:outer membrane protein TolC
MRSFRRIFVYRSLLSLIVGLTVAGGGVAAADDTSVSMLDEKQFIAALETSDPRLARLAAEVRAAEAEVGVEGVRTNPSVSFDREELFPESGSSATSYARVTWPLDVSGRRGRRMAAARSAAAAVAADGEGARFEILIDGLRVFHQAAYARLRVELSRAEREALVRAVDVVRRRTGAGAASGYDLQRIELELAAYDDQIASAETELLEARSELAALIGRADGLVDAQSSLELPAPPAPVDGGPSSILAGRSDLRAAQLRARSADQRAAAAGRGWVPDLGLATGFVAEDVGTETAIGYTLGLSITLPIFDRGGAQAARARAARRVAEAEARVIETRAPAIVRARQATLARRIEQARKLAEGQLARLDLLLKTAETGYREGESSVVELLDAYQTARETRLRDLELRRDARLAELDLWRALGRRP